MAKKPGIWDKHGHNFAILAKPLDKHGVIPVHITFPSLKKVAFCYVYFAIPSCDAKLMLNVATFLKTAWKLLGGGGQGGQGCQKDS